MPVVFESVPSILLVPQAATPVLSPNGGQYSSAPLVTITDATAGAVIHYTIDGSTPTIASPIYGAPVQTTFGMTLAAIAFATGYSQSAVVSGNYIQSQLAITTSSLAGVNQYATSYSSPLNASGGAPPYTWALLSQTSANPNTWQISGSNVTNQMPMILNVETANLVIQVTDTLFNSVETNLNITTTREIPAGASALGYTNLFWVSSPTVATTYFGAYNTAPGLPWSSGWNFTTVIPPSSLYSMSASGVFQMQQSGTTSETPDANTSIISAVQLGNGSSVPIAATLPVMIAGVGYYLSAKLQVSVGDPNIRPTIFVMPTQHNAANTQDIDPNDGNNHRWLEKDTWQGQAANGKSTPGWNGDLQWSNIYAAENASSGTQDITKEHEYGSAYAPATGTLNIWQDNTALGSSIASSASGTPLDTERVAWVNAMRDYPMIAAFNDGTTPFTLSVYEVVVYVPPLATPTFSPAPGSGLTPPQTIMISTATLNAGIYYTTDGSTPTYPVSGTTQAYTGPFSISIDTTVKAITGATGYASSSVGSATYNLTLTPLWP